MNFLPLDIRDEEDIALVLHHADYIVQYGEDLEPKQPKDEVSVVVFSPNLHHVFGVCTPHSTCDIMEVLGRWSEVCRILRCPL